MEYYIIACISFAIMYYISYTRDVLFIVKNVAKLHDAEGDFNPVLYSIVSIVLTAIAMPIYLLMLLFTTKDKVLHYASSGILLKHYDLEVKEK